MVAPEYVYSSDTLIMDQSYACVPLHNVIHYIVINYY